MRNWFHVEIWRATSGRAYFEPICDRCGARGPQLDRRDALRLARVDPDARLNPVNVWLDAHECGLLVPLAA